MSKELEKQYNPKMSKTEFINHGSTANISTQSVMKANRHTQ